MKKRILSTFLAVILVLTTFLPALSAQASNLNILVEETDTFLSLVENETTSFSFIPKNDGLYVFSFINTNYNDSNELIQYFHIVDDRGSSLNCIYMPGINTHYSAGGTDTNDYIVNLQRDRTYTVQYKNPKNESQDLVVTASPLYAANNFNIPLATIPGSVLFCNADGHYNASFNSEDTTALSYTSYLKTGLIRIQIDRDGWYSFGSGASDLTQMGGEGIIQIYTDQLQLIENRSYLMNHSKEELKTPASIYLRAGEYTMLIDDLVYGGVMADTEFWGVQSAFTSISAETPAEFNAPNSEIYVTFTPNVTTTYTFNIEFSPVDTWILEKLSLYGEDGTKISGYTEDYEYLPDASAPLSGSLTGTLTAGTTYYLGILGYGQGTVSVSSQIDIDPSNASITALYPANGFTVDFTDTSVDKAFHITFNREVSNAGGNRPELDFSVGTLEVHRASDNQVVYQLQSNTSTSLYGSAAPFTAISIRDIPPKLDNGVEYYVTMPAGFVKFADGSVCPAIDISDWCFTTKPEPTAEYMVPLVKENGQFQFASDIVDGKDMRYDYNYDETWFFNDNTRYQHDLVKMSIRVALAAFGADGINSSSKNIETLMNDLEYTNISINYPSPTVDTIGCAIGSKNIMSASGEKCSLVMVAIRGGGYFSEWGGNFNLGPLSEHRGFLNAAQIVLDEIEEYLNKYDAELDSNKKIWITGYSRGAATTNLVAKYLDDGAIDGLMQKNIYAFCFECPQNTTNTNASDSKYNNIINIVNPNDIVPKVAMSAWGYTRYGKTYYTPYREGLISLEYKQQKQKMLTQYNRLLQFTYGNSMKDAKDFTEEYIGQAFITDEIANAVAYAFGSQMQYTSNPTSFLGETFGNAESVLMHLGETVFGHTPSPQSGLKEFVDGLFEFLGPLKPTPVLNVADIAYAHYGEMCMSWLDSLEGDFSYANPKYRILFINCPVNVSVYDQSGTLVGQIMDNVVEEIEDGIIAYIDSDMQKVLALPDNEQYTVHLTATGEGTVTYTATEYTLDGSSTEKVISYYEVDITENDTLVGLVENLDEVVAAQYPLYLNGSDESLTPSVNQSGDAVQQSKVEIFWSGNGTVTGGGNYINGEFARITATPNSGETFLGWYENGILVSVDAEYRFLVTRNSNMTARFTTNTTSSNTSGSTSDRDSDPVFAINAPNVPGGKVSVNPISSSAGRRITITVRPDKGYALTNLTVTDDKGSSLNLQDQGGGKYTFTMPASKVNVQAVFAFDTSQITFLDVPTNAYYADAVAWAVEQGITNGTSADTFNPNGACTRAQAVTFLWRAAGAPAPQGSTNPFTDVQPGTYYYDAVLWAVEQGITNGTSASTFSPDAVVTRGQTVTFLHRANGSPAANAGTFSDVSSNAYYADAVSWAVYRGITNGTSADTFSPSANCTRAQIVTFLYRTR